MSPQNMPAQAGGHPQKSTFSPYIYVVIAIAAVGLVAGASWLLISPSKTNFSLVPAISQPIVIPDQAITDSLLVKSVTVRSSNGGFLLIYKSDPGTSGTISNLYITRTGYLFPGTYTNFTMKVETYPDITIPSGNLMFAVLYEDTNGNKQWDEDGSDRMSTSVGGEPIRQAFRAAAP
jgi:hypothetical protein